MATPAFDLQKLLNDINPVLKSEYHIAALKKEEFEVSNATQFLQKMKSADPPAYEETMRRREAHLTNICGPTGVKETAAQAAKRIEGVCGKDSQCARALKRELANPKKCMEKWAPKATRLSFAVIGFVPPGSPKGWVVAYPGFETRSSAESVVHEGLHPRRGEAWAAGLQGNPRQTASGELMTLIRKTLDEGTVQVLTAYLITKPPLQKWFGGYRSESYQDCVRTVRQMLENLGVAGADQQLNYLKTAYFGLDAEGKNEDKARVTRMVSDLRSQQG